MTQSIDVQDPREIDAEPGEVGGLALAQAEAVLHELEQVLPATLVQVRSSYLTNLLTTSPSTQPDALAEAWEDSPAHGKTVRALGAVSSARELLREAREALVD